MFSGSAQRNLIVVSDGGDTASRATLKAAVAGAKSRGVAVFAVGLKTPETDVPALRGLAERTGGRFAPAKTADLSGIYRGLATELSHQFVVTYHSKLTAGGQVQVAVAAPGGTDNALVLMPKVQKPPAPPSPAAPPQPTHSLFAGTAALLVVLVFSFLAVFLVLTMALGARSRTQHDRELVKRMAASPEPSPEREKEQRGLTAWLPEPVVQAGEAVAQASGVATKVEAMLERAGLPLRGGEFIAVVGMSAMLGAAVGFLLLRNIVFMVLLAIPMAAVPIVWLSITVRRRMNKLHGQLADILMILASSLRAGHGFFQALDLVAKEIGEPGAQEFGRVVAEVRLGRPVDEALNSMAERVGSDDFRWAVLGVNVQREVGGNLAEILDTIADTVRERDAVRRQVRVLSSEGRLSIGILAALPFLVSLYIAKVNPGYLNLLFTTRVGLIMVVTAVCLLSIGIFWMRKIVNIDV
jgi:tight adherence protein B